MEIKAGQSVTFQSPFPLTFPEKVRKGDAGTVTSVYKKDIFVKFDGAKAPIRVKEDEIEIT